MEAFLLRLLKNKYVRYAAAFIAVGAWAYLSGRSVERDYQQGLREKALKEWSQQTSTATIAAAAARVASMKKEQEARDKLNGIVNDSPETGGECVSSGTVERLRDLRSE